jgi:hypothetical protein
MNTADVNKPTRPAVQTRKCAKIKIKLEEVPSIASGPSSKSLAVKVIGHYAAGLCIPPSPVMVYPGP